MKIAALLCGNRWHYLDHLAPLSNRFSLPLFTDSISIKEHIDDWYPDVDCRWHNSAELPFILVSDFDAVVHCFSQTELRSYLFLAEQVQGRKLQSIWWPHGFSDKKNLDGLLHESCVWSYSNFFSERCRKAGYKGSLYQRGNVRLDYYLAHAYFYKKALQKLFEELPRQKIYLFAPTWNDYEGPSGYSFLDTLIQTWPDEINLIVKPHPNINKMPYIPPRVNIHCLTSFAPIYPLLEKVDGLITDRSSIAYDHFFFEKPTLFLLEKSMPKTAMHSCGYCYSSATSLIKDLAKDPKKLVQSFIPIRIQLYRKAYSKEHV
jgi:hypothetical protein